MGYFKLWAYVYLDAPRAHNYNYKEHDGPRAKKSILKFKQKRQG